MSETSGFITCPLCTAAGVDKRFTTEKQFIGHLTSHRKKGEQFDFTQIRSQAQTPQNDPLREFVSHYAKALPQISRVQPKRNDRETILAFIQQICMERGIKIECPNCHTKFCPQETTR